MRKLIAIVLLLAFAGAAYQAKRMLSGDTDLAAKQQAAPAVVVAVTTLEEESWLPSIKATGSLRAYQGVNVTAQEAGMITAIHFGSGQKVRKGELLLQQYDLDEQFKLKSVKAELDLARKSYERSQSLMGSQAASQSQLDSTISDMERLAALVGNLAALIDKRAIRAPFDGILGIRRVNVGQYIEPGDDIVTLQTLDPIYADFSLPQSRLTQVRTGQGVQIDVDAWPGLEFSGKIDAIEPLIDPATRSFHIEAEVPNPDLKLRPGMFVNTRLLLPASEKVLTLPQAAISYNPYGDAVFVVANTVDDSGHSTLVAKSVFVTLGETRGDQVAILSGLQAGERVVTAGQLRLRNGSPVLIDDTIAVGNSPDPGVENN